jgi:hypothetical protein
MTGTTPSRMPGIALILATLAIATPVRAANYEGHGDTGWNHVSKRDCCEAAVILAQNDSMAACTAAGGVPKLMTGSRRGLCDWEARGDAEDVLYRCTAVTNVFCR